MLFLDADAVNSMKRTTTTNMSRVGWALVLVLVWVLLPRPSFGFAFTTLDSNEIPVSNQTTGVPITWPGTEVDGFVGFGNFPPEFVPINGSASWDENALQAMQEWNEIERLNFRLNGIVQSGDLCAFGNGEVVFAAD